MSAQFLAEIERELIDIAQGDRWEISEKLFALTRRVAVEIEKIKLAEAA